MIKRNTHTIHDRFVCMGKLWVAIWSQVLLPFGPQSSSFFLSGVWWCFNGTLHKREMGESISLWYHVENEFVPFFVVVVVVGFLSSNESIIE